MAAVRVKVEGIKEFRTALRGLGDKDLLKGLRLSYKEASELVAARAKAAAPGRSGRSISARATQRAAAIAVRSSDPRAFGVFFGAKRRFGWYGRRQFRQSKARQFRPWVGNQWEPGAQAGKPYYIGDAINASVDDVVEVFGDAVEKLAKEAFPD